MNIDIPGKPPAGGPTKDEILAISLFKLNLSPDDIFADLGCGTGRVSLEAAPLVKRVFAVDRRVEACTWTEREALVNKITNVSVINADNRTFLSTVDHLDSVFVGGSQGLGEMIDALAQLNRRVVRRENGLEIREELLHGDVILEDGDVDGLQFPEAKGDLKGMGSLLGDV